MGQLLSHISGLSPISPLLNLPTEILLLVASQLSASPESIVAVSLTCETLSSIFDRDTLKLCDESRQRLLLLLEKDHGDRLFYCSACCQLHHFWEQWNSTDSHHLRIAEISCLRYHYKKTFKQTPGCHRYELNYLHGRLVMNRHLYDSPKGLPLESLAYPTFMTSWGGGTLWQQNPSAKIIGDELFLCITHTLAGAAATLRDAIDEGRHGICMHVATDSVDLDYSYRDACREVRGSCTVCLTDYVTTVERGQVNEIFQSEIPNYGLSVGPLVNGWSVTITTYHQLGRCRDPDDWKWVTLAEDLIDRRLSKGPAQPRRDMRLYPPGVIREKWQIAPPA
ncbi:hypothetical protein V8C42DRAFT_356080 [Trichoderma barbatum]